MAKWKQTVGKILNNLGFFADAAKVLRQEVEDFRFGYAERYDKDLTSTAMQKPSSRLVEEMAHTYYEEGLEGKGILPGKTRWTGNASAAQTGQAQDPIPEHE